MMKRMQFLSDLSFVRTIREITRKGKLRDILPQAVILTGQCQLVHWAAKFAGMMMRMIMMMMMRTMIVMMMMMMRMIVTGQRQLVHLAAAKFAIIIEEISSRATLQ